MVYLLSWWYHIFIKPMTITDAEKVIFAIQDEIRRSEESRYDHRLHAILILAQGMSCNKVAQVLGDAPRTIAYWVRRFKGEGFAGLVDGERPGRPRRLNEEQLVEVGAALRKDPSDFGVSGIWDGKTLSNFIKRQLDISLGVRQCQRLFRQLGLRLRKPRPQAGCAHSIL
jgi:transposase